jgi:AraC-like DNA-binding protein
VTDVLSMLLDDVRPRGAVFDRSPLPGGWSKRFDERPPLALAALPEGDGWITAERETSIVLGPGDVALVVGPRPYTVGADGPAILLSGTYEVRGSVCDRVLRGLPHVLVVRADELPYSILDVVTAEMARARPGHRAVLDRLLDLLLVTTLREWLDRPDSGAPPWYHAQADPVVGTALQLMHDDAAHPWTVAELAHRAAVSRSAFARRFTDLVGEPPMSYLACWRLWLAADLLTRTDATVDAIARRVGYANAYALSVAFKRVYGVRPGEHRAEGRSPEVERPSA